MLLRGNAEIIQNKRINIRRLLDGFSCAAGTVTGICVYPNQDRILTAVFFLQDCRVFE